MSSLVRATGPTRGTATGGPDKAGPREGGGRDMTRIGNGGGALLSLLVNRINLSGTIAFLALTLLLLAATRGLAVEPGEQLKNPALEARARVISEVLRCLVCQNETIDESSASLAHDIRVLLRERLTAGDTDEQAIQAIVKRYGTFVLLDPPVRPATYVLWFGPFGVLLAGALGCLAWVRRRAGASDAEVPLSPDETRRLDTILRETDR
jgi:cytochrome c-type biogenesis protein CcmH